MNKQVSNLIIKTAKSSGWTVIKNKNEFTFSKYSPAGQDFSFEVEANNIDELISKIYNYHDSYDVSEEAYIWLDNFGHGKNGAPHDMKDVYKDMVACKKMIYDLYDDLFVLNKQISESCL